MKVFCQNEMSPALCSSNVYKNYYELNQSLTLPISTSLISGVELVSTTSNSEDNLELLEICRVSGVLEEEGKFVTLNETEIFRSFASICLEVPKGENT